MIVDLVIYITTTLFNAIVAIFSNAWLFCIVFIILGIVAAKQKAKGAGLVCIMLAFIIFINAVL